MDTGRFGARIADAENELTWEGIFSDLKERGLSSVDLIISDGHTGIQSAAEKMFTGSSWQMCHVHFIRAVLRKVSRKYYNLIAERLRECLNDSSLLLAYAKELEDSGFSRAADTIYRFEHGLMNYRAYPPSSETLEKDPDYKPPGTGSQGDQTPDKESRCIHE